MREFVRIVVKFVDGWRERETHVAMEEKKS